MSGNERRASTIAVGVAVGVALYTGLRMPNVWTATLQAVSLFDGFHKRFAVGTVLRPIAAATDFAYPAFAIASFVVLAAVVTVIVRAALRASDLVPRVVVIAWWLLPAGGFLFHEIGYFDQVIYLILFGAIALVRRQRIGAAAVLMCVAPMVHEIAIATVIPVFGVILLRELPWRRAVLWTAVPALVGFVMVALPPTSPVAVNALSLRLQAAQVSIRFDALTLFLDTHAQALTRFDLHEARVTVIPIGILLAVAFAAIVLGDRGGWTTARDRLPPCLLFVAALAAIAAPSVLCEGGWDSNRWRFLLEANFVLVLWFALEGRPSPLRAPAALLALAVTLFSLNHITIYYFDKVAPRALDYREARHFVLDVAHGRIFRRVAE